MDGIFVSYRRRDRPLATSLLVDKLEQRYGAQQVFHDLDDIDAGENYIDRIHRALDACAVLLAVVGPDWLRHYKKKLQHPNDAVRIEICTALSKQVLVIPIVLSDACMPEVEHLPDDLKEFHFKNASRFRSTDLDADVARLFNRLDRVPLLAQAASRYSCLPCAGGSEERPATSITPRAVAHKHDTIDFISPLTHARPRFSLYSADDQSSLAFEGDEVNLNRDLLDPGNFSISSKTHAHFEYSNGSWKLSDKSSNKATFIAIDGVELARDGDWLMFGTAVFQFSTVTERDSSSLDLEATFSFGEPNKTTCDLQPRFHLRQQGGHSLTFEGDEVVVKRDSLDPNNASISRRRHAGFDLRNDVWYVTDLSSNNASFVQLRSTTAIADGTALVFGRKVFTFHC